MEVHSHTHTPSPPAGRAGKKWTHYFWEFLMLFLAVFCGFLAEHQLEHTIEHQRATVYADNLYDELKNDTARLSFLIRRNRDISSKLDTLCLLTKGPARQNIPSGMLYYYAQFVTYVSYFSSSNSTIEQLKGSGSLRIMNINVAQKISEYDRKIRELEKEYGLSKSEFEKIENLHFKIFDVYTMEMLFPEDSTEKAKDSLFQLRSLYIRDDPEMLNEYIGWLKFESNIYSFQTKEFLEPIRKAAVELIALLKKHYHLK